MKSKNKSKLCKNNIHYFNYQRDSQLSAKDYIIGNVSVYKCQRCGALKTVDNRQLELFFKCNN